MTATATIPTIIIPSMNPTLCELARSFIPPEWPVIVKDGNPHKHFAELRALDIKTKWAINVDEDCFLADPGAIQRLIATMEAQGYDMAAVQDGASNLRTHNPVIFNPYFFIFDVAKVQATPARPDLDAVAESHKFSHLVRFHELPHSYDGFEPYYPFFIELLTAGLRPLYLNNDALLSLPLSEYDLGRPSVVHGEDGAELAVHSWYSRLWDKPIVKERIRFCTEHAMANPNCIRHADLPPQPQPDYRAFELGIATFQHNCGASLRHWFAVHYAVGFRKFYFYADRCTDQTWQELSALSHKLNITVYKVDDDSEQSRLRCYQHACATALQEVDWLAVLDGNQYLLPMGERSVQQALLPYAQLPLSALAVYLAPVDNPTPVVRPNGGVAHGFYGYASLLRGRQQAMATESGQFFHTQQGTLDEMQRAVSVAAFPTSASFRHLAVNVFPLKGGYQTAQNASTIPWLDARIQETLDWLNA